MIGPLPFSNIYISDLTDHISSQMQLFADDSTLFTPVKDINQTDEKLIKDLQTVTDWSHQWKMVFYPDMTMQAIEVIFSVKKNKLARQEVYFNDIPVARRDNAKHLEVHLERGLNSSKHKGSGYKSN